MITPVDGPVRGRVVVPGSKSITNRALLVAALADGTSTLTGALVADDSTAMIGAVRALGASVDVFDGGRTLVVRGIGGRLPHAATALYAHQAATVGRFVAAVAAASPVAITIDADPQLRARPMAPLFEALRALGADVRDTDGFLPATIFGPAKGGSVTVAAGISSQFISALLIAGPLFPKGVQVTLAGARVSEGYVAMTSAVMAQFGIRPAIYPSTCAVGPGVYRAADYAIEPDASAASYFYAAAAVTGGAVQVDGLDHGSALQSDWRVMEIMRGMGSDLRGVDVDMSDCSDMVPTLAVVAACGSSPTRMRNVEFIRRKDTDRVAVTVRELRRCGVEVEEHPDGMTIHPSARHGAVIDPAGDHRMAMAFAVLGLVTPGIEISDAECVSKTFPDFFDVLDRLTTA
ncbi:MAG TPA: 3-phosphoshikimate 1-carboxyvinyltransferase [Acidimicrobiales bacterium]|nr:3-phosphoshikimate 1-carboxyvinyltransferase [Acidimicrobiales bacterium]